jgi:phosphoserine phosphatase RsbU/P
MSVNPLRHHHHLDDDAPPSAIYPNVRAKLLARRDRLRSAIGDFRETPYLVTLLQEVDSALDRLDEGTYGECAVCHGSVENDRLLADPMIQVCLSCITDTERDALERDLDLALRIQAALLPKTPQSLHGWDMHYHYQPAGTVSGDYCDLVSSDHNGRGLLFAIGDVSGKGLGASMLSAQLHASLRTLAGFDLGVDQLVEHANRLFCESTVASHYATLACGRIADDGVIDICNAGHFPPMLIHDGRIINIDATGIPIGLACDGRYEVRSFPTSPGDTLLLYTDGLCEAWDGQTEYGLERIAFLADRHRTVSPEALVKTLVEDMNTFLAGHPRGDDLTVMALKRTK